MSPSSQCLFTYHSVRLLTGLDRHLYICKKLVIVHNVSVLCPSSDNHPEAEATVGKRSVYPNFVMRVFPILYFTIRILLLSQSPEAEIFTCHGVLLRRCSFRVGVALFAVFYLSRSHHSYTFKMMATPISQGVQKQLLRPGAGRPIERGSTVMVHCTGSSGGMKFWR